MFVQIKNTRTHMKVALCFIINYDHVLNQEAIWREWIEPNQDIIQVYFYYKDLRHIQSPWIKAHALPPSCILPTSYFHVMPAYLSILHYAIHHSTDNQWFCMLTDACCPIVPPAQFRQLFFDNNRHSLVSWKAAWWNPYFHQRGNLAKLPKELWLANDPWFVLTRENVKQVIHFAQVHTTMAQTICQGGLANETYFAVALHLFGELKNPRVKNVCTHITNWNKRSSTTSPYVFTEGNEQDIQFIEEQLKANPYHMFLRKVSPAFPSELLRQRFLFPPSNAQKKGNAFKYIGWLFLAILLVWFFST